MKERQSSRSGGRLREVLSRPPYAQLLSDVLVPRQVPEDQFTARVGYSNPRIFASSIQGRYAGDRFEDDNNVLPVESLFVVDLLFSKNVTENVRLFAGVENVFDEEYQVRAASRGRVGIGAPRWIYGGIRLAF